MGDESMSTMIFKRNCPHIFISHFLCKWNTKNTGYQKQNRKTLPIDLTLALIFILVIKLPDVTNYWHIIIGWHQFVSKFQLLHVFQDRITGIT